MIDLIYLGHRAESVVGLQAGDEHLEDRITLTFVDSFDTANRRVTDGQYDIFVFDPADPGDGTELVGNRLQSLASETAIVLPRDVVNETAALDPGPFDWIVDGTDIGFDVATLITHLDSSAGATGDPQIGPRGDGAHRRRYRAHVAIDGEIVRQTPPLNGPDHNSSDAGPADRIDAAADDGRPTWESITTSVADRSEEFAQSDGSPTNLHRDQSAETASEIAPGLATHGLHRHVEDCLDRGRRVIDTGVSAVYRESGGESTYWSVYSPVDESTFELAVYERIRRTDMATHPSQSMFVRTVLDELLDIFFVFDIDLQFTHWNQRLLEVTGYSDDQVAEMKPFDFVASDDLPVARQGIADILASGQATADFDLQTSDGERIPYEWTGSLVTDNQDNPAYICGIGRDLTEMKRQAKQLRYERDLVEQIFETSPIGILVLDGEGTVTRANSRATTMLDPESGGVVGESAEDLSLIASKAHPDEDHSEGDSDQAGFARTVTSVLTSGEPKRRVEHRVQNESGVTWVSTNVAPLEIDGEQQRVIVTMEDVTDRVEHQRELEAKQAKLDETVHELRQSNAELEHFAYVASHDLKEPLRVVSNYLQLLERRYTDELDDDGREFVSLAVDGAKRMRQRIDDLLTYSRVDRHGGSLDPVDCNEVLETTLSSLSIAIKESDADIEVGDLPVVRADEDQLIHVFQNLIKNAIDNAGAEPPSVTLDAERSDEQWIIRVEDDGIGIPEDRQERIFDLFYSGPESDSTGIGLALCRKIIDRHEGRLWVESTPGEGATFFINLPTPD